MNGKGDGFKLKIWGETYHKIRTDKGKIYVREEEPPMSEQRGDHAGMGSAVRLKGDIPADGVIEFPKAWNNKINLDSLTIMITPHGTFQELYVENIHYGRKATVKNASSGPIKGSYMIICNTKA